MELSLTGSSQVRVIERANDILDVKKRHGGSVCNSTISKETGLVPPYLKQLKDDLKDTVALVMKIGVHHTVVARAICQRAYRVNPIPGEWTTRIIFSTQDF